MGVNFQKNLLNLNMTFNCHNDLEFDLDHDNVKVMSNVKSFIKNLKKSNLTSFDLEGHGQGHGQGHHWIAREKS